MASVITPNLKEAEEVIGRELITDNDVENAGEEICENFGIRCLSGNKRTKWNVIYRERY